jgi:hypothetical protein
MNAQLCKPDTMLAAAPIPSRMVFKGLLGQGSRCVATRAAPTSAIREVQQNLTSKKASAVEMVQQYLQQLEKREPSVGSFITVDSEGALAQVSTLPLGHCAHDTPIQTSRTECVLAIVLPADGCLPSCTAAAALPYTAAH